MNRGQLTLIAAGFFLVALGSCKESRRDIESALNEYFGEGTFVYKEGIDFSSPDIVGIMTEKIPHPEGAVFRTYWVGVISDAEFVNVWSDGKVVGKFSHEGFELHTYNPLVLKYSGEGYFQVPIPKFKNMMKGSELAFRFTNSEGRELGEAFVTELTPPSERGIYIFNRYPSAKQSAP